ncbi:MAG: hypothetical protein ACON5B_08810 [Myxococcota bacterium]
MAKRRAKKIKQRAAIGVLGKHVTRRSRGRCEMCDQKDQLALWELPPFPEEPCLSRVLLACQRCRRWLEGTEPVDVVEAHFLGGSVWSEHEAVRLAAARLLLMVDEADDPWVQDALDAANINPETLELRD